MRTLASGTLLGVFGCVWGCSLVLAPSRHQQARDANGVAMDAASPDGGPLDAAMDAPSLDGGALDAAMLAASPDGGALDAASSDGGPMDGSDVVDDSGRDEDASSAADTGADVAPVIGVDGSPGTADAASLDSSFATDAYDDCDRDRDGFRRASGGCGGAPPDCNDSDPTIRPGAVPICGTATVEDCVAPARTEMEAFLDATEVGVGEGPVLRPVVGDYFAPMLSTAIDRDGRVFVAVIERRGSQRTLVVHRLDATLTGPVATYVSTDFAPELGAPQAVAMRADPDARYSVAINVVAGARAGAAVQVWAGHVPSAAAPALVRVPVESDTAIVYPRSTIVGGEPGSPLAVPAHFWIERRGADIYFVTTPVDDLRATARRELLYAFPLPTPPLLIAGSTGDQVVYEDETRRALNFTTVTATGPVGLNSPHLGYEYRDGPAVGFALGVHLYALAEASDVLVFGASTFRMSGASPGDVARFPSIVGLGATSDPSPRFGIGLGSETVSGTIVHMRFYTSGPDTEAHLVDGATAPTPILDLRPDGSSLYDLQTAALSTADGSRRVAFAALTGALGTPDRLRVAALVACPVP